MSQPDTEEALRKRIETLETENERLREENEQLREDNDDSDHSRRRVLAGLVGAAAAGAMGVTVFPGPAAAATPRGTYPAEYDDPLLKIRVDRVRYLTRSSKPPTPSSGRVVAYVDLGDLP